MTRELGSWNEKVNCPVQYINYPHLLTRKGMVEKGYTLVPFADLLPYYRDEEFRDHWCPTLIKQFTYRIEE